MTKKHPRSEKAARKICRKIFDEWDEWDKSVLLNAIETAKKILDHEYPEPKTASRVSKEAESINLQHQTKCGRNCYPHKPKPKGK